MRNFYEKLKAMDEKKVKLIQVLFGIFTGILVWCAIVFGTESEDKLVAIAFIIVFLAVILLRNKISKEVGWNMKTFSFAWIISMAASMAVTLIYWLATGKFMA